MNANPKLALAAMLNSTCLGNIKLYLNNPELIRDTLLAQAQDYFSALNFESIQFDKDTFMAYLTNTPLEELVIALDEMGKNPFSYIMSPAIWVGDNAKGLWEHFVETEAAGAPVAK